MANLLPNRERRKPFPVLDPDQAACFIRRFERLLRVLGSPGRRRLFDGPPEDLEPALEELEVAASPAAASDLLDAIEGFVERLETAGPKNGRQASVGIGGQDVRAGVFVCYRPGRSLSTGEADVASQGFFDGMDRPPIGLWLERLARPRPWPGGSFEIAIVAWVPPEDRERAMRGCDANGGDSLDLLDDLAPEVGLQLRSLIGVT
ncbi:MAG TPA: hypothetical protein ENI85_10570 [Deltaproteobacteria bacterium]|nr:hypothetical protein [Deltaproteobacteria bacterium]